MIVWFCVVALILLFLNLNLDTWFLMRFGIPYLYIVYGKKAIKDIFKTHVFRSIVLPADLDYLGHMNNARYLREADMARSHFLAQYKMFEEAHALGGHMMMTSSCCRYRRALSLFQRFEIHSSIVGWDDHHLLVQQFFVLPSDGFIVAVVLGRYILQGLKMAVLMEHLTGRKVESPELTEDVQHWLKYIELNSQRMRGEGTSSKDK